MANETYQPPARLHYSPMKLFVVALLSSLQDMDNSTSKLVFRPLMHSPRIYEGAPPGVHVTTVHAYDPDNPRKKVIYNLPNVLDFEYFVLDQNTGNLTTAKNIEKTVGEVYQVMAAAASTGGSSELEHLQIIVTEFNQFAPRFEKQVYKAEVLIYSDIGTPVLQVHAVDPDPVPQNAEIYYRMDQNASTNFFSLDPISGQLSVAQPLNVSETCELVFGVFAEDGGSPKRWARVKVEISLKTITVPIDVRVVNTSTSYVVVCWKNPESGFVDGYFTQYKMIGNARNNQLNVTANKGPETCTTFKNLQHGKKYEFTIAGKNSEEIGQKSRLQYFETVDNPCTKNTCNNGECIVIDKQPWYRCDCESGFYGSHCELYNYCVEQPCKNDGICKNITHNEYICICNDDFTGHNCDIYNPCMRNNPVCKNGGTCEMTSDGSYLCICPKEYNGSHCENEALCSLNPCLNGGTCSVRNGMYTCICPNGFKGKICDAMDPCYSNPCFNDGVCRTVSDFRYICECRTGYFGQNCQIEQQCFHGQCQNGGMCQSVNFTVSKCLCPDGFMGEYCENIDYCYKKPCYNGGTCTMESPYENYLCICPNGYYGEQCDYEDPCSENPCRNGGTCEIEFENIYSCVCLAGYHGKNCESMTVSSDKNACISQPCQNGGTCESDFNHGYSCLCAAGYYGPNCEDIDPCLSSPCVNGGSCKTLNASSFSCSCPKGFIGDRCENEQSCSKHCYNGGTCKITELLDYACSCPPPYFGPFCQYTNTCLTDPCQNGATCEMDDDHTFFCSCVEGYWGLLCEDKDPCYGNPCEEEEVCEQTSQNTYICICEGIQGPHGFLCASELNPCNTNPCGDRGTCQRITHSKYSCKCNDGFYGTKCEYIDYCSSGNYCKNGGTCINSPSKLYFCQCVSGYTGMECEHIDACASNPCHENSTCISKKGNFSCKCPPGQRGRTCNIIEQCRDEIAETDKGLFYWNKTDHGLTVQQKCPHGSSGPPDQTGFAKRICFLHENGTAIWSLMDVSQCNKKVDILVEEIADDLNNLTNKSEKMTEKKLMSTTKIINSIIPEAAENKMLAQKVANVFSQVLDVEPEVMQYDKNGTFRSSILKMVDDFASRIPLKTGETSIIETENIHIHSSNWHPGNLQNDTYADVESDDDYAGLKFEIPTSSSPKFKDGIMTTLEPISTAEDVKNLSMENIPKSEENIITVMQVYVPPTALRKVHCHTQKDVRVNVMVYYDDKLFQPKANKTKFGEGTVESPADRVHESNIIIKVPVIKINVGNVSLSNLTQPLVYIIPLQSKQTAKCVFWKEKDYSWSSQGLKTKQTKEMVICESNHLTAFSVLLDPTPEVTFSEEHKEALSVISYIGCTLSILGLLLTILTYSLFRCLNRDHSGKILLNLCLSLLLLNLVFLIGAMRPENGQSVCAVIALLLHFFLLTSLSWMCVEAVNMYQLLVHVFASSETHFLLKRCLLAWGIPFLIVGISTSASCQSYLHSNPICMLSPKHPWVYYSAFLAPCCIMLALNVTVFVLVARVLFGPRLVSQSNDNGNHLVTAIQVRGAVTVLILLGVTWVFGTFAVGDVKLTFQYIFCITNSLQGFLIFLVRCLLYPEARGAWMQLIKHGKLKKYKGGIPTAAVSWSNNSHSAGKQRRKTTSSTVGKYNNEGVTAFINTNASKNKESKSRSDQVSFCSSLNSQNSNTTKNSTDDQQHFSSAETSTVDQNSRKQFNRTFNRKKNPINGFSVFWQKDKSHSKYPSDNDQNAVKIEIQSREQNDHILKMPKEQKSFSVDIICSSKDKSNSMLKNSLPNQADGKEFFLPEMLNKSKLKSLKEQRSASLDASINYKNIKTHRSSVDASMQSCQRAFYRSSSKFKRRNQTVIEKEELQSDDSDSTDIDECSLESPEPRYSQEHFQTSMNISKESIRI